MKKDHLKLNVRDGQIKAKVSKSNFEARINKNLLDVENTI